MRRIGSVLRRFVSRQRRHSLPQCVGGCIADAHFYAVAKINRLVNHRDDFVQVDYVVAESPELLDFHFCHLAFLKEVVV